MAGNGRIRESGANIIVKLLEREGVDVVAGIPGGANLPLYDALGGSPIQHILVRHEQAGGFLAQGMARSTGKTGVCFATSGPGATNLITAVADAKLDSVPLVAVTGQVGTGVLGTDAFQEIDTYGMTQSITKHNYLVRSAAELLEVIPEAFRVAASGRQGPVLIDVPKDVQSGIVEFDDWPAPSMPDAPRRPDPEALSALARMLDAAERPLIYAGGGVMSANASGALLALAERTCAPVSTTLMALGAMPRGHGLNLGMPGMHGAVGVNALFDQADFILCVGARFDDRVTGKADAFASAARVAHIDADAAEINKIRRAELWLVADARLSLEALIPLVSARPRPEWAARVERARVEEGLSFPEEDSHPLSIIRGAARLAGPEAIVATDVGQHQMWAAQAWPVNRPRSFLTSGGLGTMGFGLPTAMGAALANPGRKTVLVTGDGSFMMNIQELATLAELDLDLKIVLLDNGYLGLVRQQQELFYGGRFNAVKFGRRVDFAAVAAGFGVPAERVALGHDPGGALSRAFARKGPALVQLEVSPEELVFPMTPPGRPNAEALLDRALSAAR